MTGKRIALLACKFIFPVVFKLWEITNLLLCTISNDKLIFLNNWNTYLTTHMYKIGKLVASPFSLWLWQSFMRYFCHFLDLLIDKSASDVSKESWLNHKISVVCAVKILEGDTAMFSWMHIPSNTTVPKGWHDDTASKSYLQIVTKKDVEFETLQCQAENKHTVKYHAVNVKKLSMCY